MFLWFGDSWIIGSELGDPDVKITPTPAYPNVGLGDQPMLAYPRLVSDHYNENHINFAKAGGSIHFAAFEMNRLILEDYKVTEPTTAFLNHTGELRRFGIATNKSTWHEGAGRPNIADQTEDEKTLANREPFCLYDYVMALNHFYLAAHKLGINVVIYNCWCLSELWDEYCVIPDECFYSEEYETLSQYMAGTDGSLTHEESMEIYFDWKQHPNEIGHKLLAKKMISMLDANLNFTTVRHDLYK